MKNSKQSENKRESILKILLSSAVIAAIITSSISIVISYNTGKRMHELEEQKYDYTLHFTRYEKLQESLKYFATFKVFDVKSINNFDISVDDSLVQVLDMLADSTRELVAQIYILSPYLSDKAFNSIPLITEDFFKNPYIDMDGIQDDKKANERIKDHMKEVNEEFDKLIVIILNAINLDMRDSYIPR